MKVKTMAVVMAVGSALTFATTPEFKPVFRSVKISGSEAKLYSRVFFAHGKKADDSCWLGIRKGGKEILIRVTTTNGGDKLRQIIHVKHGKKDAEEWRMNLLGSGSDQDQAPDTLRFDIFAKHGYRDAAKKLGADIRKAFAGFEGIR